MKEQNEEPVEIFMHAVIDKLNNHGERLKVVETSMGEAVTAVGEVGRLKSDFRTLAENEQKRKLKDQTTMNPGQKMLG